jgi:hypothetical protein
MQVPHKQTPNPKDGCNFHTRAKTAVEMNVKSKMVTYFWSHLYNPRFQTAYNEYPL